MIAVLEYVLPYLDEHHTTTTILGFDLESGKKPIEAILGSSWVD